jgi:hypothetical protein
LLVVEEVLMIEEVAQALVVIENLQAVLQVVIQ